MSGRQYFGLMAVMLGAFFAPLDYERLTTVAVLIVSLASVWRMRP